MGFEGMTTVRIALVRIFQISNTFSRKFCDRDQFELAYEFGTGSASRKSGISHLTESMIRAAAEMNVTIVPILSAVAPASGRVTNAALDEIVAEMNSRLADRSRAFDALVVVMSGCMVSEDWKSADELVLRAARGAIGGQIPLLAILSTQANLNQALLETADLSLSFDQTDPVQVERTARKALELAVRLSQVNQKPVWEMRKLPLLVPLGGQRSSTEPLVVIGALAAEFADYSGVLDVSIFAGFPYADTEDAGCSVLVTAESDREQASNLANRLRAAIWTSREAFHEPLPNIETVVHEAMLSEDGPTVIADAGDDPGAGASGEGTGVLWALIDLGARDATLALIVDPVAVAAGIGAGIGSQITIDIGGAIDRRAGYPIEVKAWVRRIADGRVMLASGETLELGRAIVLVVEGRHGGEVEVIVSERSVEPSDPEIFQAFGIDLATKKIIAVKSSWRFHAAFAAVGAHLMPMTTPGITTPVLAYFDFQRVPRPIYPLDLL
jgi:microcystin degradation protein MlrC